MGSYEPTLADSIRIYKNYCINKGEISVILSEVYKWLAQEPLKMEYKDVNYMQDVNVMLKRSFVYMQYM